VKDGVRECIDATWLVDEIDLVLGVCDRRNAEEIGSEGDCSRES